MVASDSFDADWESARAGTLETPTPTVETPAPQEQQAPASAPEPSQPQQFQLPDEYQQRIKQTGFGTLDEALQAARQFQSIRGQLPNLEQKWQEQHLTPLQQRLQEAEARAQRYESERQQALEQFVLVDPQTGRQRAPQEQAAVRQQIAAQQQQEQQSLAQQQAEQRRQAELAQREQQLAQREQMTQAAEQNSYRMAAISSIEPYKQSLAQQFNVPVADLDAYINHVNFTERVKNMSDIREFGTLANALGDYAAVRASQLAQDNAGRSQQTGRYTGGLGGRVNSGTGGQSGTSRWDQTSSNEFDTAWERAKSGKLV